MNDAHALSGAYAIDAVDDLERVAFERHLANCPDCQREVAEIRATSVLLATTSETAPPAALRDSILAEIQQIRPLPPLTANEPAALPGAVAPGVRRRAWVGVLAAAATVAAMVAGGIVVSQQNGDPGPTLSAVEQVLRADDAQSGVITFEGGGSAILTRSESLGLAVLVAKDMPAAPDGHAHELWLLGADGSAVPAGLMGAEERVVLEGDAAEAVAAAITVEPEGGSDQPTTEPIAVLKFSDLKDA